MEWVLFYIIVVIIVVLVFACCCVKRVRRACCWHGCNPECCKRIEAGDSYTNIFKKVKKIRKKNKTDKKTNDSGESKDKDIEMMAGRVSRLQSQMSNTIDEYGNKVVFDKKLDLELKQENVNGKTQFYLEKKWNIEKDTGVGKCMKWIYNSWLFSPLAFFIWEIGIVIMFAFLFDISLSSSVRTALDTYVVAFVGIFSVLLSLIFANGVEKNKENKRLFQALCGDIKAMAMWFGALTNDNDKYTTTDKDPDDEYSEYATIRTRDTYEVEVEKIRLLLAVLAPVAKHVLRNAPSPNNPNYYKLDDKLRIRIEIPDETTWGGWFQQLLIQFGVVEPENEQDESQAWANLKEENDVNKIKVYLYKKIQKVADTSGMDLFEVVMYCLLDTINVLNEQEYLGKARYAKERDFITKWQHIYGSWGTMASITTYKQPTLVHLTIFFCLSLYTVATTIVNRNLAYVNFTVGDGGDPYSYYSDWTASVVIEGDTDVMWSGDWWYFHWYVIVKSIFQILPFTWLYFLSNHIGQPFKKGMPDAEVISKDASDTQYQVSNLMTNRACLDAWDMVQPYSTQLTALNRDTYASSVGVLYPFKAQEDEKRKNVNNTKDEYKEKLTTSRKKRKTKRGSLTPKLAEAARRVALEGEGSKGNDDDDRKVRKRLSSIQETTKVNGRKIRFKNVNF